MGKSSPDQAQSPPDILIPGVARRARRPAGDSGAEGAARQRGWPAHVQRELALLQARFGPLAGRLPSRGAFDAEVVTMARSMYRLHDRRAAPKRAISMAGGSVLVEKKVHGPG